PGVYEIACKPNGKSYIGSAKVLNTRRKTHFLQLSQKRHYNSSLQEDWNRYGAGSFEFRVLERVKCLPWMQPLRLLQAEQKHIESHSSLYNERAAFLAAQPWWYYLVKWL